MAAAAPRIVRTARDAACLFEPRLVGRRREALLIAHLAGERRLLRLTEEGRGEAGRIALPVRAIIADAMRLESAGLILAHCHPSGEPEPSHADIVATRKLRELGAALGLTLHDHLIFAGGECRSFRALGLL
ncbi:JAB domain-containing protein [Sphingosinicella humi]|uniref:DNA repair protein RadC n=1 Tax=Allosphingosinicella humi TaxID=2068657 RepID=A0A2U2J0L8_9SPHN|nr:JAB domain-containing protein [Sphingosinicella humi]PWG01878.1 DNA repair protein RadC [Sphingosinicella humi]